MDEFQQFLNLNVNIILSVEAISSILTCFLSIREVKVNDQFIHEQIQEVNDQRAKFITFCYDTKSLSNALVNYSNDILSTVKVIEEKNFKREDLLAEYSEKTIKGNIKSDTKQELLSTVEIKNALKKVRNYTNVIGVTFTGVSVAAGVAGATGAALCIYNPALIPLFSEKIRLILTFITLSCSSSASCVNTTKLKTHVEMTKIDNKIIELNAKLKDERDQLEHVIKIVEIELRDIIKNINSIVTHWEGQVNSLEANIDKLERGQLNQNLNIFDISAISKNANEVKKSAQEYHWIMNLILTQESLIR
ncbi:3314_t:CDS:2 [Diversispora eburnea]|uniref:3314_t:CDS:1 n=1 Tax=Diversispora eburnea TaxID=1213867 RepID=A0A9N8YZJ0_9GLOM|nr:3314_t:CDS:2 [Diversispora eburnea]